jgi:hypothetical protein
VLDDSYLRIYPISVVKEQVSWNVRIIVVKEVVQWEGKQDSLAITMAFT